jgi:hypothetical protein
VIRKLRFAALLSACSALQVRAQSTFAALRGIEFLTLHFACDRFVVHNERLQISLTENARELSVVVRKSEAVALGHPVVPVADGFVG